jgi:phage gpG-like protein
MIKVTITEKNADKVLTSLKSTDERLMTAIGVGLARGLLIAVGVSQAEYLTGPRPERLEVVTSRLRGSIQSEVEVSNNAIIGRMGSNVPYAAYHEFGYHGVEQVKAHNRVSSLQISNGTVRIVHEGGTKQMAKQLRKNDIVAFTQVKAHARKVDYDGRPYLRPALAQTDIGSEIDKEIKKVANQ